MDASRWSQSAYPTYSVEMQQRCVCALEGEQTWPRWDRGTTRMADL